jgi:hypothetical protein
VQHIVVVPSVQCNVQRTYRVHRPPAGHRDLRRGTTLAESRPVTISKPRPLPGDGAAMNPPVVQKWILPHSKWRPFVLKGVVPGRADHPRHQIMQGPIFGRRKKQYICIFVRACDIYCTYLLCTYIHTVHIFYVICPVVITLRGKVLFPSYNVAHISISSGPSRPASSCATALLDRFPSPLLGDVSWRATSCFPLLDSLRACALTWEPT